jgi:hypothetical protein
MKWNEIGDRRSVVDDGAKSEEANPFSGIAIARIGERSAVWWGVGDIAQDMEKTCGSPVSPYFDLVLQSRRHSERGKFSGSSRESL